MVVFLNPNTTVSEFHSLFVSSVLYFIYKKYKSPLNFCHRATDITGFAHQLEISQSYVELLSIPFQEYVHINVPNGTFYSDLFLNKKGQSKTWIGKTFGPSITIWRLFHKYFSLTHKAMGTA